MVTLNHYPQLQRLAWNRRPDAEIPDEVVLELYERHWNLVDPDTMEPKERELLDFLVRTVGHGHLHV